jgi:hypothetical protein
MRNSKEQKSKLICHRLRTFVLGLALGNWSILGLSDERHKFDRLEDAVYELEVCASAGNLPMLNGRIGGLADSADGAQMKV